MELVRRVILITLCERARGSLRIMGFGGPKVGMDSMAKGRPLPENQPISMNYADS
jgi:hypothetical protein